MTQEALKDLLDAVEAAIQAGDWKVDGACDPDLVIRQAKEALAQTEQERTWVGLTDLQKGVIKFNHSKVGMMLMTEYDLDAMLEATEQALKEKNT